MPGEVLTADTVSVQFEAVCDIQEFIQIVKEFEGDMDMVQGRMTVDAKSILGICSLNMNESMFLHVHSGDFEQLLSEIHKFTK